jgi:hypothetical protein
MGVGELHSKFRAADNWPRQAAAGQTTDEKERATPHAAVVFTKSSASGSGRLHVQSAVFLPLGNAEVVGCQGKWDFSLICHAFFFVDSSRRHIESFDIQKDRRFPGEDGPMTEAELRRAWNCSLFTQLVCPQVLPAFAQFVGRTDLTFEEIELLVESLSAAFKDSSLFQKCQEWLFARHSFFYQIGETACLWRLGEAGVPIYAIPDWKGDINGLFAALPGLKTVIRDTSVTFSGKPLLADGKPEQIPDKSLAAVISGGCANVYGRSGILPYVLRLLPANLANREPQSALVRAVIGLCRLALTTPDAAKPEDRDERLRLFSRLPPRAIIQLPFESKEVGLKLASALAEEELPVALLWKDWTDKLDASGKLSWDSIKPLLVRLANYVPEDVKEVQQRSAICVRLLESASDLPSNWRDQIRDLALFEVELVGFGLTSASISELRQFLTNRSLFCGGKELAGFLRAAAPGLQLAHISVGLAYSDAFRTAIRF